MRNKLLLTVVVALLGWFGGATTAEKPAVLVQPRRDAWHLPPLPKAEGSTTRAAIVATSPQWGAAKAASAADAQEEAPRWRLAGVYGRGKQGGVLILYDADRKPAERLKVGEKLPSGHVIELVDGNQVRVRLGKKRETFGVENRE
ncbi:MAG: hypothetical protein ACT6S0_00940 [Roseateles sp.]|uniref:hypothetical protein n=1 Tax=Roseateles sp. TaxID=1971397 RepID=UPI00403741F7